MRVYVAGKFEKKEQILDMYKRIEELGHSIAYDWTTHKPIKPYSQNQDIAQTYSENELEGISKCDVFIYLADKKGTTLPMEFGAALMLIKTTGKPIVYAVGEFNDKSPWFFNPLVKRRNSIADIMPELNDMK